MSEKPILFSGKMVRAILAGRKTQTRRVVKLPLIDRYGTGCEIAGCEINSCLRQGMEICPYGKTGDHLWVRETHIPKASGVIYRADFSDFDAAGMSGMYGGWKPSIFMKRKYSRITLAVKSVRVERLQGITEADAEAEGCCHCSPVGDSPEKQSARQHYQSLWTKINGEGSWESNPWVWVIEFKSQ